MVTAYRVSLVLEAAEADAHLLQIALFPVRLQSLHKKALALNQGVFGGAGQIPRALVGPKQGLGPGSSGDQFRNSQAFGPQCQNPRTLELLQMIKMNKTAKGATRQELRSRWRGQGLVEVALESLAIEGLIYTTVDQDHFKATDA